MEAVKDRGSKWQFCDIHLHERQHQESPRSGEWQQNRQKQRRRLKESGENRKNEEQKKKRVNNRKKEITGWRNGKEMEISDPGEGGGESGSANRCWMDR